MFALAEYCRAGRIENHVIFFRCAELGMNGNRCSVSLELTGRRFYLMLAVIFVYRYMGETETQPVSGKILHFYC